MKLEQLTYPVEQLERMTDSELEAAFAPYFPLTRPEQVKKQAELKLSPAKILTVEDKAARAKRLQGLAIARAFGIDV